MSNVQKSITLNESKTYDETNFKELKADNEYTVDLLSSNVLFK